MLGTLNEKKALVYFASGLKLNGVDNQAQLRSTLNAAIRANVSFYPIDARGLVASAPLGDATPGIAGRHRHVHRRSGAGDAAGTSSDRRTRSTRWRRIPAARRCSTTTILSMGIVQAQKAISSYYIIGYYTTNTALDGKFRRIKITLKEYPSAKLDYRQGYFAGKEFTKFTTADKERQLEDALMLGDPITDLTIAMEVNYFQLNRAEYYVPVVVKIPGSELALARRGGAERTVIDFIGEIKDEYGTTIQNIRDKVDIKLSGETAAEWAKRPDPVRHGLHAAARQVHDQGSGARRGDGQNRNLSEEVRDSEPEQGRQADPDQLRGAEQPARGSARCAVHRRQGQGPDHESAGSGRPEADSERDPRVQQEPRHVCLSAGLSADGGDHAAAGRVCDVLSRARRRPSKHRRCR